MPALMTLKRGQIDDPAVTAIYIDLVEAADWDADDPRLPAVADRLGVVVRGRRQALERGQGRRLRARR
jgi:hypothetical protein